MTIKIAVDCMGGDFGVSVTVPAAIDFVNLHKDIQLILVGIRKNIEDQLGDLGIRVHKQLRIVPASEIVSIEDSIETVLRRKKNSSMHIAINLVKNGEAQACVSAGNTGALMGISCHVLKTVHGIERPALSAFMPSQRGHTMVLDLGANIGCGPQNLLQFAKMGHIFISAICEKTHPTIGLLNIGQEITKGNDVIKRASELLRSSALNFYGNVEGNDIFRGTTDVVVCDGFVGNSVLKASEGLSEMFMRIMRRECSYSALSRLETLCAFSILKRIKKSIDYRRYSGAVLLGLRGLVIKSHGSSDVYAFSIALDRGYQAILKGLEKRIEEIMNKISSIDS